MVYVDGIGLGRTGRLVCDADIYACSKKGDGLVRSMKKSSMLNRNRPRLFEVSQTYQEACPCARILPVRSSSAATMQGVDGSAVAGKAASTDRKSTRLNSSY